MNQNLDNIRYYLIATSDLPYEEGLIFHVKENKTITKVLRNKFIPTSFRTIIKLSTSEYKYYRKIHKTERINRYTSEIFKKICDLTPGDKCKFRIKNKYLTVEILKKKNLNNRIHLICIDEDGRTWDIDATLIDAILPNALTIGKIIKRMFHYIVRVKDHLQNNISKISTVRMVMVNNILVISPQSVNSLKGKSVEEKYIIFKCEGNQCWALLKWKGIINDSINCLGCDITNISDFGSFVNQSIFKYNDECGVLIPVNMIENCCVTEGHRKLSINNNRIDERSICCIKQTKESKSNVQIKINERVRKTNGKETGIFYWVGLVNEEEVIGLDSENLVREGTDGTFCGVRLFYCNFKCGALFEPEYFENELKRIVDIDRNVVDACHVQLIENGNEIRKIMYINVRGYKKIINIKWRGIINGDLCVGCELENESEYGTDGTFISQRLFKCGVRKGIIIPVNELRESCESNVHRAIVKSDGFIHRILRGYRNINSNHICCIEWLTYIKTWPQLKIDDRIKCKNLDIRGTCKWIGLVNGKEAVGVEMDNECNGTNGRFCSFELFTCSQGKGILLAADDIEHGQEANKPHFLVGGIINPNQHLTCHEIWNKDVLGNRKLKKDDIVHVIIKKKNEQIKIKGNLRWSGLMNGILIGAVELIRDHTYGTNGMFWRSQLFTCPKKRAIAVSFDNIYQYLPYEQKEIPKEDRIFKSIDINSDVKYYFGSKFGVVDLFGTVKWSGIDENGTYFYGLELDKWNIDGTDGEFDGQRLFQCPPGHGFLVPIERVNEDTRFAKEGGLINPNKYFKCEESWNIECLEERNLKKDNFVFITIKIRNEEVKLKGILRWCGKMNQSYIGAVELNQDHEYGTDGMFWRSQLFKCPNKRAIAVPLNNVYQYFPYEQKEVPIADRIFPEIDINSAVEAYFELNDVGHFVIRFGTVKWTGVDEYGEYFYGLELDNEISDGTDGEFGGQRLFQCRPGHGILSSINNISKDSRFTEEGPTGLEYPNNHYPEIPTLENISQLIENGDIQSIRLLLDNCDLTSIPSHNFLKVASLALKNNDDDLFNLAIENCEDRNTLLENGETFLTNLLKENHSEERIVTIIQKNNFDPHVNNEKNESPFILACKMGMASVVEKIIPKSLSLIQRQDATKLALEAQDNIELLGRQAGDIFKICALINRVPADQGMDCTICMDKGINIVLECGHVCCDSCSGELSRCPYCYQDVGTIKRIYLP